MISAKVKELSGKGNPILILHGTDTMTQSAAQVLRDLSPIGVPIVFTGAMRPLGFEKSDAVQNLTEALLVCRLKPPGVYIACHGRVFEAPLVQKNRERLTFEAL